MTDPIIERKIRTIIKKTTDYCMKVKCDDYITLWEIISDLKELIEEE